MFFYDTKISSFAREIALGRQWPIERVSGILVRQRPVESVSVPLDRHISIEIITEIDPGR